MRSSYSEKDVTILLKDITGMVEPLPANVREKYIQSGKHYCEMLPLEYKPGEEYFGFIVNGEPLFINGTNWVPADAFHSRDAGRIDRMLELANDIGCNMLRCWGGNVYEDEPFFDRCDELRRDRDLICVHVT